MKLKLNLGDALFEPLSRNDGEITAFKNHPDGKLVTIRWRREGQTPHDTEHFYDKLAKSIKKGDIEHTPKSEF